jgi:hypothetical protein
MVVNEHFQANRGSRGLREVSLPIRGVVAWLRLKQASCHHGRREVDIQENRMLQYPHISSLGGRIP